MSWEPKRDFTGYGAKPPDPNWPNGARLAVNFVMNYEEGSEPSVQDGEGFTELGLTEAHGLIQGVKGRDLAGESMFEYGSRVGFWRLVRLFHRRGMAMTGFGWALPLEANPGGGAIRRGGLGRVLQRVALNQTFRLPPQGGAGAHQEGYRLNAEDRRRTALRLVLPLRPLRDPPPPRRGRGRVPLRQRLLR